VKRRGFLLRREGLGLHAPTYILSTNSRTRPRREYLRSAVIPVLSNYSLLVHALNTATTNSTEHIRLHTHSERSYLRWNTLHIDGDNASKYSTHSSIQHYPTPLTTLVATIKLNKEKKEQNTYSNGVLLLSLLVASMDTINKVIQNRRSYLVLGLSVSKK